MDTAEDLARLLYAVSDDPAVAVRAANRRERVDRALEAVERVVLAGNDHFKRLVIFILANFAFSHIGLSRAAAHAEVFGFFTDSVT